MTISIGQTVYQQFSDFADPGQLVDCAFNEIVSFPAAEVIPPGRAVEMAADGLSVQLCQQTSSTFNPVGISVQNTAREGTGAVGVNPQYGVQGLSYQPGETVRVLMRGRIWAEWKGTTQPVFGAINTYHSSTISTDRGKFTDASTSTGAGTEVSTSAVFRTRQAQSNSGTIVELDVNLPGAAA